MKTSTEMILKELVARYPALACVENDVRAAYDALYAEYLRLHDYFGKEQRDVMLRLRNIAKNAKN